MPNWVPLVNTQADSEKSLQSAEPISVAVLWKDSVYEKPGSPSVRGFGGRVFLYDGNNEPVKADGELIVYGYDESNPAASDAGADKKFVFPSKHFQQHYGQSDLGHSYSVWVPWEKVGGIRKSITLITIFKTATGKVLRSGQSINTLPGKKPTKGTNEITEVAQAGGSNIGNSPNVIAQASFDTPAKSAGSSKAQSDEPTKDVKRDRLRTTTLNLSPSLAKKMAGRSTAVSANQAAFKPATKQNAAAKPPSPPSTIPADADAPAATTATKAKIFGMPGAF